MRHLALGWPHLYCPEQECKSRFFLASSLLLSSVWPYLIRGLEAEVGCFSGTGLEGAGLARHTRSCPHLIIQPLSGLLCDLYPTSGALWLWLCHLCKVASSSVNEDWHETCIALCFH